MIDFLNRDMQLLIYRSFFFFFLKDWSNFQQMLENYELSVGTLNILGL